MKVVSFKKLVAFAALTGCGAVSLIAACSSQGPAGYLSGDDTGASSGASGGGGSSGGDDGGAGSSGGGSSGGDATLVTYDGPPPSFADGSVSCSTPNGLSLKFNPMYSGFDGVHTYKVPALVEGADPATVTWGASDPTMVHFDPYVRGIMITTKKAGTVQIIATVTSGGTTKCGTAPLTITSYTPAEWDLGNARYNNGNPLPTGNLLQMFDASLPDGGIDAAAFDAGDAGNCMSLPAGFSNPFEGPLPAACTNCHSPVGGMIFGVTLFMDVSHTPEQTGGYSDTELTNVFVNGTVPPGGYFDNSIICYPNWHAFHTWYDINTPEGQKGMNAYLRSLTPEEQLGCFDIYSTCDAGGG